MDREERLAYQRGYAAGVRNRWPEHKPPCPPDSICRELLSAAQNLRDQADGLVATFSDGDVPELSHAIDRMDEVLASIGRWVRENEEEQP